MADFDATRRAQQLRREAPTSEVILWKAIRHGQLGGLKFRRQELICGYAVDFACVSARLVIEIDGPSHRNEEQAAYDFRRTQDLESSGWQVIRFTNEQVRGELMAVLAVIEREARPNG